MNQLLILLCEIIHAFQKERGSLCLYLSIKDDFSKQSLNSCFQNSNRLIEEFELMANQSNFEPTSEQKKSFTKLNRIFNGFICQTSFRKDLDDCNLDILDVTPLYTHRIIIHLTYILIELALFDNDNNPAEISAISNFINWKERIGRARALGIVGFALNEFDSEQFSRDFSLILSEQKLNKRSFLSLASDQQKQLFNKLYSKHENIENIHQKMEENEIPQINAQNWFTIVTKKMEMMHKIETSLFNQLYASNEIKLETYNKNTTIDKTYALAMDFPIFRNLSENTTSKLFQSSNIKNYKKGSLLFLQGEQASRIYVILSGWIKIHKSSADGNESVKQMLSTGNLVIESSIFASEKYYNNAQACNDAKLLSFPASIFRHLLTKDPTLALNTLKYQSQHSREHLNQIDNNRLKSSRERVGWFLLKQFIEQKNPNTILLPYDKTIIASLLDMKPETFSRSLKTLKTKGLKSEKHQIQVNDIKLLCQYCDTNLEKHCQFKNKHDCKFNK